MSKRKVETIVIIVLAVLVLILMFIAAFSGLTSEAYYVGGR